MTTVKAVILGAFALLVLAGVATTFAVSDPGQPLRPATPYAGWSSPVPR